MPKSDARHTRSLCGATWLLCLALACGAEQDHHPHLEMRLVESVSPRQRAPAERPAGELDGRRQPTEVATAMRALPPRASLRPPPRWVEEARDPAAGLGELFARLDLASGAIRRTAWQALPELWRELPAVDVEVAWRSVPISDLQAAREEIDEICRDAGQHAARALKAALTAPHDFPSLHVEPQGIDAFALDLRTVWVEGLTSMPGVRCRLSTRSSKAWPTQAYIRLQRRADHIVAVELGGLIYLGCAAHWEMGSIWAEVSAWATPQVLTLAEPFLRAEPNLSGP